MEFLGTLEGILEVKLPTIWADEKAEVGRAMQRREEKRREKKKKQEDRRRQKRERVSSQKKEDVGARKGKE